MTSATHRKQRRRAVVALSPIPQIIARIPRPYPPSPEALGALITNELLEIWLSILSDTELDDLRERQQPSATGVGKLDLLILRQAETMGWRLGLSQLVHMRFSAWELEPDGPMLFARYGKALAKASRRSQKREPPPIDDPELYQVKQETVQELRRFLRNFRNTFSGRRARPSLDELIGWAQKTISAKRNEFIHLYANIDSWVQYFRANSISIKPLLQAKRTSPAALFDSWLAWCKGLETETVRQKISELGRFVRDSRES